MTWDSLIGRTVEWEEGESKAPRKGVILDSAVDYEDTNPWLVLVKLKDGVLVNIRLHTGGEGIPRYGPNPVKVKFTGDPETGNVYADFLEEQGEEKAAMMLRKVFGVGG